jgi:hypothetical protein
MTLLKDFPRFLATERSFDAITGLLKDHPSRQQPMGVIVNKQDSGGRSGIEFHLWGPNEGNRAVTALSTVLHPHETTANSVLDFKRR